MKLTVLVLGVLLQAQVVAEDLPPCDEVHAPIVEDIGPAPLELLSLELESEPPSLELLVTNTLDEAVVELTFKLAPAFCPTWHHQPAIVESFPGRARQEEGSAQQERAPLLEAFATDRIHLPADGLVRLCQVAVSRGCDTSLPATFTLEGFRTESGQSWRLVGKTLRPSPVDGTSEEGGEDP